MLRAAIEDARIDSRSATLLLIATLSFALGIFISLLVAARPEAGTRAPVHCPEHCPRLILMSTQPAALPDVINPSCGVYEPAAAFEPASVSAAP
jgi:hypothetical protein